MVPRLVIAFTILALGATPAAFAQNSSEIKDQIEQSNAEIERLQKEIRQLQTQLNQTTAQKQTLQTAVQGIDLNIQKLQKSISLTNAQIKQKDKEISGLSGDITTTAGKIEVSRGGIADSLRALDTEDRQPLAAMLLSGITLSGIFDEAVRLDALRNDLRNQIETLSTLKVDLEETKSSAEDKRKELRGLEQKLSQEKQGLTIARTEQNRLLTNTKNQESTYQALIAQKQREREAFEAQLRQFEAQLGLTVAVGDIPKPSPGILSWPTDAPFITQYFGNTEFATKNAQIYGGKGHNAIDLRASDGTPIRAARAGTVTAMGNTDEQSTCYSYGKWILIRHDNGLSTLYAHLSLQSVSPGQQVGARQLIGYSGRTGYATGPHLHFGVFATAGIKIAKFEKSIGCKQITLPLVDPTGYLNPLSYLPSI